jgi:hypothetical protein
MDIENISSKSDIHNYLESNIEAYKEEIKNIIKHSDFTSSQQQDLNDIAAQYYYSLNDIVKSIKLLSE